MANDKQRRRRLKEKRHEYDLVEIDGDGEEKIVRASDLRPEANGKSGSSRGSSKNAPKRARTPRVPQPPNWRRVGKRTAIFAPIFFVATMLLGGDQVPVSAALLQTVLLMAVFTPLSYLMDGLTWRIYQKRLAKDGK